MLPASPQLVRYATQQVYNPQPLSDFGILTLVLEFPQNAINITAALFTSLLRHNHQQQRSWP